MIHSPVIPNLFLGRLTGSYQLFEEALYPKKSFI